MKIPENIDYSEISGLSNEIRQKLELIRPKTFGPGFQELMYYPSSYKSSFNVF